MATKKKLYAFIEAVKPHMTEKEFRDFAKEIVSDLLNELSEA